MELKVVVKTSELLDILTKNREKHYSEYKEAVRIYHKKALEELRMRMEAFKAAESNTVGLDFKLPRPKHYLKSYDTAIGMFKMHQEPTITLSSEQFQNFIQDNWNWRNSYSMTTGVYNNTSFEADTGEEGFNG